MKYNVNTENYKKRFYDLVYYMDNNSELISIDDSILEIMSEETMQSASVLYDEIDKMISFLYFDEQNYAFGHCIDLEFEGEEDIYFDWFYGYLLGRSIDMSFRIFIRECDGFLSYLRIREILENLKDMSEKDNSVKEYIRKNDNFSILKNDCDYIIKGFTSQDNDNYPNWSKANNDETQWEKIEQTYCISKKIENLLKDISVFLESKDFSIELKELKNTITYLSTYEKDTRSEKDKIEIEDLDYENIINKILEIAKQKMHLSEDVDLTIEDELKEFAEFKKHKYDILLESGKLFNIRDLETYKKYLDIELHPYKNFEEESLYGTSAVGLSGFIDEYINSYNEL